MLPIRLLRQNWGRQGSIEQLKYQAPQLREIARPVRRLCQRSSLAAQFARDFAHILPISRSFAKILTAKINTYLTRTITF